MAERASSSTFRLPRVRSGPRGVRANGVIHLLLTDVVMGGMGGRELAGRLRLERPDVKMLFMSGYTGDAIIRHGVLRAHMAFIAKPFPPDAIAEKVRNVLDGVREKIAS